MSSTTPHRSEAPNPRLYSPNSLRAYNTVVRLLSHELAWRCPYRYVEALYTAVGPTHLEVGPGDGRPLARLPRTTPLAQLHLVDLNPACLATTQKRVGHRVESTHLYEVGALASWPPETASVDSVGASDLLHCVPGNSLWDKRAMFDNAARVLRDGGEFFGATFLSARSLCHTRTARRLLRLYNGQRNTMHNHGDTIDDLAALLRTHPDFTNTWVDVAGSVMLFSATRAPRTVVGGESA